ncbi:MAG: hypothetical protein S4CHLAM102_02870 [Chlamydiia bacterium]|nr:hypothetical protein [Chlamydiia bacterium]
MLETLYAVEGQFEKLKEALTALAEVCRLEEGCLQYDLLEPVGEKDAILVVMRWEDVSFLRTHEASAHIDAFVEEFDGVVYGEVAQTEWYCVR